MQVKQEKVGARHASPELPRPQQIHTQLVGEAVLVSNRRKK